MRATDNTAIPALYLRRGRVLRQVTPVQASRMMDAKRARAMEAGGTSAGVRDIELCNSEGKVVGHVSFNGRVWLNGPDGWRSNIEIPLPGVKTVAQCEAEGWR